MGQRIPMDSTTQKTLLDDKYEKLRVKVNEVEKQQEEEKIRNRISGCSE